MVVAPPWFSTNWSTASQGPLKSVCADDIMNELFTNRPRYGDFSINFFLKHAENVKSAQLACPYFTDPEPIKILKSAGCEKILLLVCLCEATSPEALKKAKSYGNVDIRFFTKAFHAKFYILGDVALVGSANLTDAGLKSNRELSVSIQSEDQVFDGIPTLFDKLWNSASVLTTHAMKCFQEWRRNNNPRSFPPIQGVEPCSPPTINVNTQSKNRTRTYLETFRCHYVEQLIPAYQFVEEIYAEAPTRHPAFAQHSYKYEIDRFLFWVKGCTTDEDLHQHPLRYGDDLRKNLHKYVSEWLKIEDNLTIYPDRLDRIDRLQRLFDDEQALASVKMYEIADMLQGDAAFVEMQRFTKGGLESHIEAFKQKNSIKRIRKSFHHLAFGSGDYVQRVYDCVFEPEYKLFHWGKNCTLELFGWVNKDGAPPFNGRSIKALRFLGLDVPFTN